MDWYALFIVTGREEYIQRWLRYHFDESILRSIVPKRRLSERKDGKVYHNLKTMFPGYVLIQTTMDEKIYSAITSIPKFIQILGNGTYYSKIDEEEIAPILKLIGNNGIIDYSKIFIENSRAVIKSGPLYGLEGIIQKVDTRKNRARILLSFMGSSRMIDVGIEMLEKAEYC